jgi:ABC-type sugar transport system substrate-binding protein/anti-anti-sigma regulatory factor
MTDRHNLRIGYVPYELFHTYWAICTQGIKARAAELGITIVLPSISADEDIAAALADMAAQQTDAVILPGNLVGILPHVLKEFDIITAPVIVAEYGGGPRFACAVHTNEVQGADAVLDELARRIDGCGKVAQFGGGRTLRYDALYRLLERQPRIELAFEMQGEWTRADGARMMREALAAHPDLRGVFAHNDQLALGALDVIAEQGYDGRIVVIGFDGIPEGLAAVHQGKLSATVYRSTYLVGRMAVDMAALAARGEQLPPEVLIDVTLITAANIVEAALDSMSLLPMILQDLLESNKAQLRLQQDIIAAQQRMIQELSTPIIPISDKILVLPLIGTIDSARAQQIMDTMLVTISKQQAAVLIIDITGVAIVDTGVAHYLLQAARAAQLLGTRVMLVGISPEVAQTVVQLGVDLSSLTTYSSLQFGLAHARTWL